MVIAIESLLFLLAGIVLAVVLTRVFARPVAGPSQPEAVSVKLVRSARTPDGREETRLLVNDKVILVAANDGIRLAEYADEVEQLEAVAARVAAAMHVQVQFARIGPKGPELDNGVAMRDLSGLTAVDEASEEPSRMARREGRSA